jgi:hypothetical protein
LIALYLFISLFTPFLNFIASQRIKSFMWLLQQQADT